MCSVSPSNDAEIYSDWSTLENGNSYGLLASIDSFSPWVEDEEEDDEEYFCPGAMAYSNEKVSRCLG